MLSCYLNKTVNTMISFFSHKYILLLVRNGRRVKKMKRHDPHVVTAAFQKCPSYDAGKQTILLEDLSVLFESIGQEATPEQPEVYKKWWTDIYNGILPLELVCAIAGSSDDNPRLMKSLVHACDFDKYGFISKDEFRACMHCILAHDPDLPRVDYNEFLKQADTNYDGKVSLDEAVEWCIKNAKISN